MPRPSIAVNDIVATPGRCAVTTPSSTDAISEFVLSHDFDSMLISSSFSISAETVAFSSILRLSSV